MILCESVKGNLKEEGYGNQQVDYVEIEWYEAYKRIHQKNTRNGKPIGIRLGTEILTRGLREGDILWKDEAEVIVVTISPSEVIVIDIDVQHPEMAYKVCYEIGNRHAALLYGENTLQFITPYNEPALQLMQKLHGVRAEKAVRKMDFDKAISAAVSSHTH
ncbi:urease accessory protein UreE [Lacrimispora sp.]|uniref:urease accessory protein UreE n=1 Tax=Lacrimispora sp. TaxID=2719234 RepID=UPI0039960277